MSSTALTLHVGDCAYETTNDILLSQDADSYFHNVLSGRWDNKGGLTIQRPGGVFVHVLFYLQFGDLPRNPTTRRTLLNEQTLKDVKAEAEFYLLTKLVELCQNPSPPPLFIVTNYWVDSQLAAAEVLQFESYPQAKAAYEKLARELEADDDIVYEGDDRPEECT